MTSIPHPPPHHRGARFRAAVFAILGLFISTAAAQSSSDAGEEEVVVLSPFEVSSAQDAGYRATKAATSTGISLEIAKTPLNVQVISSNFIEDLNLDSMHQTLRFVSGVQIDEFNRDASGVRIRGFQVGTFYRNGYERRFNFSTDNVERIEVVKGPVSTFFGQGNPGGIVNYITKKPEFKTEGELDVTLGSYDYKKAVLDYQFTLPSYNKVGFRIIAAKDDSEDWRSYEYLDRDYLALSARWRPSNAFDIRVEYETVDSNENLLNNGRTNLQFHDDWANPPADVVNHFRSASRPTDADVIAYLQNRWNRSIANWANDIGAVRGTVPPRVTTGDLSSFYPEGRSYNTGGPGGAKVFDTWSFEGEARYTPTDWFTLRYNYNYSEAYVDQQRPFGFPNGDRTIPVAERTQVAWEYLENNNVDALFSFETGSIKHRVLVGGKVEKFRQRTGTRRFDYSSLQPVQTRDGVTLTGRNVALYYDPFIHPVIDTRNLIKEINPTFSRNYSEIESLYASHQGTLFDDRLNTLIGVRRESNDDGSSGTTPTFGANFEVTPGYLVFASYSENFRVNGPNITGPGAQPNEIIDNLEPETAKGIDIGIKTNWRENTLSGTFSYFQLENTNIRRNDTLRNLEEPRNLDGIQTNNVFWYNLGGQERSEGIETDLIWAPSPQFEILVAYSYTWEAKIVADPSLTPGTQDYNIQIGRRLTNTPEHQFKTWMKYSFAEGPLAGFSVGFGGRYVGPTEGATHQSFFDIHMPSYTVFDLRLGYNGKVWGRDYSVSLLVENLADEIYLQGQNNIFADPRKFYVRGSIKF